MANPYGLGGPFGLGLNPGSDFMRELQEWTRLQIKKEREEEEENRYRQQQQQQYMMMQQYLSQNPPTYGGISRGSLGGLLGGGLSGVTSPVTPAAAPAADPHKLLTERIAKLSTAEPAKISQRSPDYCHMLTAFRGWTVKNEKLAALGQTQAWEPKKAKAAKCTSSKDHRAPVKDCQCGYWSFKSMNTLTEALKGYVNSVTVVGAVEIWGRVIECENGWRSEFAYPKELWLLKPDMEHLSWSYGVPVRRLEEEKESKKEKEERK